ncbi:MAG: phage tail protein I [Burkholderia gladioli]
MSDFTQPSILPPILARDLNARALETVAARVAGLDLTPLIVYDFDAVPASALPFLAEQFRMLGDAGWSFATTQAQQRALLKEAIALHRIRGTPFAVDRVLRLLGVNATVIEWFEDVPRTAPYTFALEVDTLDQPAGSPQFDIRRWSEMARLVNFWKNARSVFRFRATSAGLSLATGIVMMAAGAESSTWGAEFDHDDVDLPLGSVNLIGGVEHQTVHGEFQ